MRRLIVVTAVVLLAGSPASAQFLEQFEESLWGVQASLTPEWRSAGLVRDIFGFEKFDLSGSDFTVGFARGRMRSGHWGLSFLRQEWREVSVCGDLECYGATGSVRLRGVTANWFVPFGSPFAGDRLQVGMHVDAGAGWFQGNVRVDEVFEGGLPLDREGTEVPAHELLPDGWLAGRTAAALPCGGGGRGNRGARPEGDREWRLRLSVQASHRDQRHLLSHGRLRLTLSLVLLGQRVADRWEHRAT